MLTPLIALTLLAASPPDAAEQIAQSGQWTLANGDDGCLVHAASNQGTVLSITAAPGEDALLFVIQNQQLAALDDGQQYSIDVEFDDLGPWQIEAIAQSELDQDGPGVIFAVRPGRSDGQKFIKEFLGAGGMRIGREGERLDTVALNGGNHAMSSLAQCLGQQYSGSQAYKGQGGPMDEDEIVADPDTAI